MSDDILPLFPELPPAPPPARVRETRPRLRRGAGLRAAQTDLFKRSRAGAGRPWFGDQLNLLGE